MAETVIPSVRGRQRAQVYMALNSGAVASAALAGFVLGLLGQAASATVTSLTRAGATSAHYRSTLILGVVAAGLTLDLCYLAIGRPTPFTLGRQVPQAWGRLFPAPIFGLLYGARLGVGPLTILSTWMWWAAMIGASALGVWTAVAVSVWFALTRMLTNVGVARLAGSSGRRSRLSSLGQTQRTGWSTLTGLGFGLVALTLLTGCGLVESAERPMLIDAPPPPDLTLSSAAVDLTEPAAITPAYVEDFVRSSTSIPEESAKIVQADNERLISSASLDVAAVSLEPSEPDNIPLLASFLPTRLGGMTLVSDASVDRFLSIDEAAAIQPDPTEEIALLETRGYRGGWIRAYRSSNSDVAVASVYQFRNETEAEFYLEDGLITIGGYGGQFFDIARLPSVRGFQQDSTGDDDGVVTRTMGGAFFHEDRWHLLYFVGSPDTVRAEVLVPALEVFYSSAVGVNYAVADSQ